MYDENLFIDYNDASAENSRFRNATLKIISKRASCRNFSEKRIPVETLEEILEAGTHAPSAGNLQPYSIIKIQNYDKKVKLTNLCGNQAFISKAPVSLLFCIDWRRIERWAYLSDAPFTATKSFRHFWVSIHDTIICAQSICIAADSLGLGSVYVGNVFECFRELRSILGLPKGVLPVVLLCLGYPKSRRNPQKKLGTKAIVHNEKYQEMSDKEIIEVFKEKYGENKIKITEDKLKKFFEVCSEAHGKQYASKCLEKIKENGYINPIQRDFGLLYPANLIPKGNAEFLQAIREAGFNPFEEFEKNKNSK